MDYGPFRPSFGQGQTRTAGAAAPYAIKADDQTVVAINLDATEHAYLRVANAGDATAADMLIPAGGRPICIEKGDGTNRVSLFSTGSPDVYIITGNGWLTN